METMTTAAEELMQLALSDPRWALESGEKLLGELDESDYEGHSETLRAMSMAARHVNEIDKSISYARRAAEYAYQGGLTDLRLMGLLTMSGSLAIAGRTEESLTVIEEGIEAASDPHLKARFVFQSGAVLDNAGNLMEALGAYAEALPVFRRFGDEFSVGQTINRLGRAYTTLGRFSEAESYLLEAHELAEKRGELTAAHGIMHNIGLLAFYRGDIPSALDWLERSDALHMEISGADAPQHVARAEVLISVGRFEEALGSARRIADSAGFRNDVEHQANALLVAARAALMGGHHGESARHAQAAAEIFRRVARVPRRAEADAIAVEARFAENGSSPELLVEAEAVIEQLAQEEMKVATAQARFVAARIADGLGQHHRARLHLEPVAATKTGPVEVRLQSAVARARLAEMEGEPGRASRAARGGLRLMDRYQATLGATELRMGIEKHGTELAEMGLRLALESGRPRRVLEWLDRTRARALRVRPLTPSGDDEVSDLLADLRRVTFELRKASNRGDRDLERRRRRLEETIARAERVRSREEGSEADSSLRDVIDALDDTVLYELGVAEGRLFAVVVRNRRTTVVELGDIDRVSHELSHLRFDMRRAARRGRPFDDSQLETLARALFGQVDLGEAPVLIVPPPTLMSVPWAALPRLRGRSMAISPSAEMWWSARMASGDGADVLVVGGPDLQVAEDEVRRVGALYDHARVMLPGTTVDQLKGGVEGVATAHIACHATFQVESPMFSSLRLGDGDLNIYDIERLENPPALVVLSACDSGYTETRAGDELAGLTSALLSMGTRNVVASVGLVPDSSATSDLMVDLHKGLVAGLEPAVALSAAQSAAFHDPERFIAAVSFVCVGA
jgi:tetratricopeptide (TPR) repeat protein